MIPQDVGIGQLFWGIRDAVVVGDADTGCIVLWNPAAERLFGMPATEAVGSPIEILVPEPLRERHRAGLARFRQTASGPLVDSGRPVELPALRRGGEPITIELTLSPIARARVPGRFVLAVIRDATARKEAEADRMRLAREQAARVAAETEAARQGEAAVLLETLLAAAPNGFALFDRDLRFARVNQAFADINGIPIEAHLGRTLREVAPKMADSQEPLIRQVLEMGEPICDLEVGGETPAAMGRARHWLVNYYPVDDRSGNRLGVGAVVIEITERKALERLQQELLAAVSHDLKNPLTVLQAQAQLLGRRLARREPAAPDSLETSVRLIERLARRMVAMVNDLADAAQFRAGHELALVRVPTDLVSLVRGSVDEHRPTAPGHRLEFRPAIPELVGDWDGVRLERVVANLLSNATKYSPEGGSVTVEVGKEESEEQMRAVLVVRDEGLGIPAADLPWIFEGFRRGSNVIGRVAGTGIGLAVSRQIVAQHGGSISVASQEGTGTTVTVRLPLTAGSRATG